MREQKFINIEWEGEGQNINLDKNKEFLKIYETALLLSLLEKQLLTQEQFDLCRKKVMQMGDL